MNAGSGQKCWHSHLFKRCDSLMHGVGKGPFCGEIKDSYHWEPESSTESFLQKDKAHMNAQPSPAQLIRYVVLWLIYQLGWWQPWPRATTYLVWSRCEASPSVCTYTCCFHKHPGSNCYPSFTGEETEAQKPFVPGLVGELQLHSPSS